MSGSGPKWLSPSDPWHHPKPWFDRALTYARAAGWWYRKAGGSGHIHGTAFCQPPDDRANACKYVVFSTGGGGESAAREFERLVRRCPHNTGVVVGVVAEAAAQLDKVEALCRGAAALLELSRYEQDAAALFDRAEQLLTEAGDAASEVDELLTAAFDMEEAAQAAGVAAEESLGEAATPLREPGQLLELADESALQVKDSLKQETESVEVRGLKRRVREIRTTIRSLRARLPDR
ncbi:hypothetical protein ABZS77_02060 [Micromonospora sp. NPDC005298]|uniref:hypothetical protein n=1 Tax=Micromonospora sp. NPDC005298 TaxID=3156873 RepID=UPI0033A743E8